MDGLCCCVNSSELLPDGDLHRSVFRLWSCLSEKKVYQLSQENVCWRLAVVFLLMCWHSEYVMLAMCCRIWSRSWRANWAVVLSRWLWRCWWRRPSMMPMSWGRQWRSDHQIIICHCRLIKAVYQHLTYVCQLSVWEFWHLFLIWCCHFLRNPMVLWLVRLQVLELVLIFRRTARKWWQYSSLSLWSPFQLNVITTLSPVWSYTARWTRHRQPAWGCCAAVPDGEPNLWRTNHKLEVLLIFDNDDDDDGVWSRALVQMKDVL